MNKLFLSLLLSLSIVFSFGQTKKKSDLMVGTWKLESCFCDKFDSKVQYASVLELFKDGTYKLTETSAQKSAKASGNMAVRQGTWKLENNIITANPILVNPPEGQNVDEGSPVELVLVSDDALRIRYFVDKKKCEHFFVRMK